MQTKINKLCRYAVGSQIRRTNTMLGVGAINEIQMQSWKISKNRNQQFIRCHLASNPVWQFLIGGAQVEIRSNQKPLSGPQLREPLSHPHLDFSLIQLITKRDPDSEEVVSKRVHILHSTAFPAGVGSFL